MNSVIDFYTNGETKQFKAIVFLFVYQLWISQRMNAILFVHRLI